MTQNFHGSSHTYRSLKTVNMEKDGFCLFLLCFYAQFAALLQQQKVLDEKEGVREDGGRDKW